MNTRKVILLCVSVGALAGAGVLTVRHLTLVNRESQDFPDGIPFLCTRPECQAEFVTTLDEMSDYRMKHPEELTMPCPKCGKSDTVRAVPCQKCKQFFPRSLARRGGDVLCPQCTPTSAPAL